MPGLLRRFTPADALDACFRKDLFGSAAPGHVQPRGVSVEPGDLAELEPVTVTGAFEAPNSAFITGLIEPLE